MTLEFRIVRRAFSEYEVVKTMNSTWIEALNEAKRLQRELKDGEYFEVFPGADIVPPKAGNYQSGLDWL